MARPTEWRRVQESFVAPGNGVQHSTRAIAVFAGETVGRVRFQYQCSVFPSLPFAPWGVQGVLGVRVQQNLSTTPDLDPQADISSDDWLWIEGFGWRQEFGAIDDVTGDPVELISAPADGGYRDVKAQRRVISDGAIWLQDSTVLSGSSQGNHYLSYQLSALIILP